MKIFEIIPQLSSGGAERFTIDLCNELSKEHDVTLVVLHSVEKFGFYADELSPKVHLVSMNKRMGFDAMLPYRLWRFIKKEEPDVVHTHLNGSVYTSLSAAINRRVVYCHTVHTTADKEAGSFVCRGVRRLLFKTKLSTPITISEESHRSFLDFYGIDAPMIDNGRNIPMNLKLSADVVDEFKTYRRSDKTRVLVCLARMYPVKRHTLLAKVTARLYAEGYDFTVLAIGSTNQIDIVEEVKSLKSENFYILGERKNPLEYLKAADAYALCSSYEGLPISLIEALGVGAVPVCTPVGGIVNLVHDGENGILAAGLEEEDYYNAMKRFLDLDDEALCAMSKKAKESYAPFSMTECAQKYVSLFEKLRQA